MRTLGVVDFGTVPAWLAFIAAVAAVAYAARQFYLASVQSRTDIVLRLEAVFEEEMLTKRSLAAQLLLHRPGVDAKLANDALQEIWQFFNTVGTVMRRRTLPHAIGWSEFYSSGVNYYVATKDLLSAKRAEENNLRLWIAFDHLIKKLQRFEARQREGDPRKRVALWIRRTYAKKPDIAQAHEFLESEERAAKLRSPS